MRSKIILIVLVGALSILAQPAAAGQESISGSVMSGSDTFGAPLKAVPITLYVLGPSDPLPIASTVSDADGHFSLKLTSLTPPGNYYLSATVGQGIELTALLGPTLPTTQITLNEKSSVSAAYALAQFSRSGKVKGSSSQLSIASKMVANLVNLESGSSSAVLTSSPNGNQSISLKTLQSLSNLLAAIVKKHSLALRFFSLTRNEQGLIPTSTSTAFSNLARDPSDNAKAIYNLSRLGSAYPGALKSSPDAWVLAVKVNNSGDPNHLIGGVGNIVFDTNGYAWVTNNVVQGTPQSSDFMLLFKPDGTPSDGSDGYLPSPIQGGVSSVRVLESRLIRRVQSGQEILDGAG